MSDLRRLEEVIKQDASLALRDPAAGQLGGLRLPGHHLGAEPRTCLAGRAGNPRVRDGVEPGRAGARPAVGAHRVVDAPRATLRTARQPRRARRPRLRPVPGGNVLDARHDPGAADGPDRRLAAAGRARPPTAIRARFARTNSSSFQARQATIMRPWRCPTTSRRTGARHLQDLRRRARRGGRRAGETSACARSSPARIIANPCCACRARFSRRSGRLRRSL